MKRFITIKARRMSQAGLIAIICFSATNFNRNESVFDPSAYADGTDSVSHETFKAKPATAYGQKRDNLTDAESELIRFHQELDKRIEVFIKAADRRFAIINGTAQPSTKKSLKDEPDWGDLPKGTHAALLSDIAGILDEAITNIDDVSSRDARNPLVSRALRKLTTAANGYLNQIVALRSKTTDPDEIAAMERVADNANQIIEAGGKLGPAPAEDNKKKKKP